jgi:hypothetical protein
MSVAPPNADLTPAIRGALSAVRRRIRAYVWIEGVALTIAALGLAFWLGMAWDWSFEPSPAARRAALVIAGAATLFVAYRYLLRRIFVPISDTSAAVLLERRFPELREHLITAVDVATGGETGVTYHPQLVAETTSAADASIANIEVARLFNHAPLLRSIGLAAAVVISVAVFAIGAREGFGFWLQRIALSEEPWPRRVHLEVVGFPPDANGQRTHKLAQDDDLELLVQASTDGFESPEEVEIRFRLADGRKGRDSLIRVGSAVANQTGSQLFRYEFKHVASDMEFDIVGGDDRVRDLRLQVVDRPELFAIELECVYPKYLGRESRRLPVTGGMRIPEGSQLILHANSTKPLTAARVRTSKDNDDRQLTIDSASPDKLAWDFGTLASDDVLIVTVTDIDGVASREPYRISLSVMNDDVPQVAVRLAGIGSAITPDAILPIAGKITDDYGLDRVWVEYQVDGGLVSARPLAAQPHGEPALEKIDAFDARATDAATGRRVLELKPKQRLALTLKASDRFDLTSEPRAGSSQQFMLDVVTPADLLALLERRELALRQRFEAIYEKLTDTRNLLSRIESNEGAADSADSQSATGDAQKNPADNGAPSGDVATSAAQRMLSRRRLRISGSLQNVVQATDEVKGVAEAFDDLGAELVNNRVDNPDLRSRLGEQIAQPLHQIAERRMPELVTRLKSVEERIADLAASAPELKKAIVEADAVLVAMRQVLDKMLELETYNEVVALLRGIITDQDEISRRTLERRKEKAKGLLEN